MSLVCHNCGNDMRPSDDLPDRDGTMVYPNVLSLIWIIEESATKKWVFHYTQAPVGISLCFQCIADKLPNSQQHILGAVYAAYRAEVEFRRVEESEKGRWISSEELRTQKGTYEFLEEWQEKQKAIPVQCIFCNAELPDNKNPCFSAFVMDRVYCETKLTWFMGVTNYSWSDFKVGRTRLLICFECFKKNFFRNFEQLSYDLRGVPKSTLGEVTKPELLLTPDFVEALKEEVGGERAEELLQEASDVAETKLVINLEDTISNN